MYALFGKIVPLEEIDMAITNITELRKNLYGTIDYVIKFNEPVQVTTKNGNAVLLSESDYNSLLETVYLMSQPGLVKRIKEGEKEKTSELSTFNPNEEW